MNSRRLVWPLAVSLALHLCLGWLFSPGPSGFPSRNAKAVTLTVTLAGAERSEVAAAAAAEPVAAPPAAAAATADVAGELTQKARFLVAPDLSALEEIAVPFSGRLTLRLEVSALGTVDRVIVVDSDPVPKELVDGLVARFAQGRLAPAMSGSKAVASTMDLEVRFEAAPTPLSREPAESATPDFARRAR